MAILATPNSGWFIERNHALIYDRWHVVAEVQGAWRVGMTVGVDVLKAVFGDDVFRRPCSSYWIADDFGNLVKVQ